MMPNWRAAFMDTLIEVAAMLALLSVAGGVVLVVAKLAGFAGVGPLQ